MKQPIVKPQMFQLEQDTPNELIERLVHLYMHGYEGIEHTFKSHFIFTFNAFLTVADPAFLTDLDFGVYGFPPSRWQKFVDAYLDQGFFTWLESLQHVPDKTETGYSFKIAGHKHGNCITHISYHKRPYPTITLLSRASTLVPTSVLELTLCGLVAQHIRRTQSVSPVLNWFITQLQFSPLWAFRYLHNYWVPHFEARFGPMKGNLEIDDSRASNTYLKVDGRYHSQFLAGKEVKFGRERSMFSSVAKELPTFTPAELPVRVQHMSGGKVVGSDMIAINESLYRDYMGEAGWDDDAYSESDEE